MREVGRTREDGVEARMEVREREGGREERREREGVGGVRVDLTLLTSKMKSRVLPYGFRECYLPSYANQDSVAN